MYNMAKFVTYIFLIISIGILLFFQNHKKSTLVYFIQIFTGGSAIILSGFWVSYYLKKMLG